MHTIDLNHVNAAALHLQAWDEFATKADRKIERRTRMPSRALKTATPQIRVAIAAALVVVLAGALAAADRAVAQASKQTTKAKSDAFKVLFIGNSHLFVNDVPARVKQRLKPVKGPIAIQTFAFGGARLSQFTDSTNVAKALKSTAWDVVVLQEASASFLTAAGRRRFHRSIAWFLNRIPATTRVVLYQTWPWRTGSTFFEGQPTSASKMWQLMQTEYAKAADRTRITIAPVGHCWVNSPRRATYYSSDGVHATVAGSRVAAAVITRTILRGASGAC